MIRHFAPPGIRFLGAICVAVLCGILTLGLWPFHVPPNEVTWLRNQDGLRFGRHATVMSSNAFTATSAGDDESGSLEVWLQPRRIWDSGTFLAFYAPEDPFRFSLRQSQTELRLRTAIRDDSHPAGTATLFAYNIFRRPLPVFLTITSGPKGTVIYVDGAAAKESPQLRLSTKEFTGRLIVGDSPRQSDSWSGQVLGLAIYRRQLTAPEVHEHYESWIRLGRLATRGDERNVALYLFDERGGNVVHNHARSGVDLHIPDRYVVLDQVFLESPRAEFNRDTDFWGAVLKNVVGFVPLGLCFCAYLSASRRVKRVALVTVSLGISVSLIIEILQAYIPTRASGVTDLITNTIGTYLGVVSYRVLAPLLNASMVRRAN
jgi:VanZ family protein